MATSVSLGEYQFYKDSTGGRWYWKVQANNTQNVGQLYYVYDIQSPFGSLSKADIPIPGDVVEEMNTSLQDVRDQLSPLLALVSPGTTTFSSTVTEGEATSTVAVVPFLNVGAFGSFLTATATPGASWLKAVPSQVIGIGKNAQSQFSIQIIPTLMEASGSPYSGQVNLQDNRSPATLIPLTFNITVLPKPEIDLDVTEIILTYTLSTAMAGSPGTLVITNSGPSGSQLTVSLAKIQNASPWLLVSDSSVGPLASSASDSVTFSIITSGIPALAGTYTENINISSSTASNSPQTVAVKLIVSP